MRRVTGSVLGLENRPLGREFTAEKMVPADGILRTTEEDVRITGWEGRGRGEIFIHGWVELEIEWIVVRI